MYYCMWNKVVTVLPSYLNVPECILAIWQSHNMSDMSVIDVDIQKDKHKSERQNHWRAEGDAVIVHGVKVKKQQNITLA